MTSRPTMTVTNRHSGTWHWHLDRPERLHDWFADFPDGPACHLVKDSCGRQVWRIQTDNADYHLKYSWPLSFAAGLLERFRHKAAAEFHNACRLRQLGIPGLEYHGYAENGGRGMLLSATLPDAIPFVQWWWQHADGRQERQLALASALCRLVSSLHAAGLRHGDWHGNNVLCTGDQPELHVIDPAKISHLETGARQWPFFAFMARQLPETAFRLILRECGWPEAEAQQRLRQWLDSLQHNPRATQRVRKSLKGNSYLTTRRELPGASLFVRKTPWLTEANLDLNRLEAVTLPATEAESLWFNSLLNFAGCELSRMPLAWRKNQAEPTAVLYYGPFRRLWSDSPETASEPIAR